MQTDRRDAIGIWGAIMTAEQTIDAFVSHAVSVRHDADELRHSVRESLAEVRTIGQKEAPGSAKCEWYLESHEDVWESGCGNTFFFNEDGPKENGFKFCPYCGGRLEVQS